MAIMMGCSAFPCRPAWCLRAQRPCPRPSLASLSHSVVLLVQCCRHGRSRLYVFVEPERTAASALFRRDLHILTTTCLISGVMEPPERPEPEDPNSSRGTSSVSSRSCHRGMPFRCCAEGTAYSRNAELGAFQEVVASRACLSNCSSLSSMHVAALPARACCSVAT